MAAAARLLGVSRTTPGIGDVFKRCSRSSLPCRLVTILFAAKHEEIVERMGCWQQKFQYTGEIAISDSLMSDIFLSYASEDRARAAAIAKGLEVQGWSVWWDRNIAAGERFAEVIENEIRRARCIVVLWSSVSVKKDWVKDEAADGQKRGILVPVFLEPLVPPLGFRQIQAADLSGWHDDPADAPFQALCRDIASILDPASRRPAQCA